MDCERDDQLAMNFDSLLAHKLVKIKNEMHTHSEVIFRLVQIGNYLGLKSWIGKREQSADSYGGMRFSDVSLQSLPFKNLTKHQKEKIQQIDVIWFDKLHIPRYAFEVEETTSINTGIERFASLLDVEISTANQLYIVAPKSRERKLATIFRKESTFIGHPYFMENKVKLIYKEDFEEFYNERAKEEKSFSEVELQQLAVKIEVE
ncbi:MAG: hypothetical protein KGZ58_07175 [Ignavibacteriales bacterium]|nr:hypothetical protein [Ignavibacteriales bacterium]